MHGNLRYVKSVLIGLATALALASPARGELVADRADRGVLAVAADGTPYVAWTIGRVLFISVRNRQGSWRLTRLGTLPAPNANLAGITIGQRPHHYVSVLAQDPEGRWISLARGSRVTTIAWAAPGSSYGPAGLALDARGRPAVAYAVQRASSQTFLRLATFDSRGKLHRRAITQKGFPTSALPPGAAPVLVNGRLHVVETYTSAAIDWAPTAKGGWGGSVPVRKPARVSPGPGRRRLPRPHLVVCVDAGLSRFGTGRSGRSPQLELGHAGELGADARDLRVDHAGRERARSSRV